jgi:hypothetical protein
MTMMNTVGSATQDNALVISQLNNAMSIQNKEAMESNNLRRKEIERQIKREEKKKDQTKKIHPLQSLTCSDVPQLLIQMMRKKILLQR